MLAKALLSKHETEKLDLDRVDFNTPIYIFFIPYELYDNSVNYKLVDQWQLGCYTMRPIDVAACMPHVSVEFFAAILHKTQVSSVLTNSDEGLLYWLCLNPDKRQKYAKMKVLLTHATNLDHKITELHVSAAMGEPLNKRSTGTPDKNGLYPYHYAIAARSNNFISWLPPKEELKIIDSGYYQGVSFFWWLAYHFSSLFIDYLIELKHPKLPDVSRVDFDSLPSSGKYPERNVSLLSCLSDDFFKITERQPKLLQQMNMNGIFTEEDGITVMNGLLGEYASDEICNWLEKHAFQCKTHIDLYGIINEEKAEEANQPCLFEKIAVMGEHDLIAMLLSHPEYPIKDLRALYGLVQKRKLLSRAKNNSFYSEIDYDQVMAITRQELKKRSQSSSDSMRCDVEHPQTESATEEDQLILHESSLDHLSDKDDSTKTKKNLWHTKENESFAEKITDQGAFKKPRRIDDEAVSKDDQDYNSSKTYITANNHFPLTL